MPDDTPQIDWMHDPNFHSLPLAEKHKVLLQIDPAYKGLPAKEQAKALDAIHYGTLGQISGQGISSQGAGSEVLEKVKSMIPPTPDMSSPSSFLFGHPSFNPSQSGIAQAGREASHEYQRSTQAGSNPLAAAGSAGVVGAGSLATGLSNIEQEKLAEQGEGGKIIGQSAVPAVMAAAAPLFSEISPRGRTAPKAATATAAAEPVFDISTGDWILSPKKTAIKYGVNKAAELLGRKGGATPPPEPTPFPGATSSAMPIGGAQLPQVPQGSLTPFPRVMTRAELNAQARAATAAAKPVPPSPFGGMTSSAAPIGNAPLPEVPQGSPTPFPTVARKGAAPVPTPEDVALAQQLGVSPQDLISRTKPIVKPGEAPTAAELKRAGDMTQVPLKQLQVLARFGDRLAQNELVRRLRQGP